MYVPNGMFWGSAIRPHIGDLMMNHFFTLGSTMDKVGFGGDTSKQKINFWLTLKSPSCRLSKMAKYTGKWLLTTP